MKLLSVIVPFYSNKAWLNEALESIKNQTYKNLEVIVIVDGSKEDINELESQYLDYFFIYKENGGSASARNMGLAKAKGEYIAFLDSDDIWPETKLEEQHRYMLQNNSKVTYHSYYIFNNLDYNDTRLISFSNYRKNIWLRAFISLKIQISTVMIHRDVIISGLNFPLVFKHGQDIEYFKDLAEIYDFENVEGITSYFRVKPGNIGFDSGKQLQYKSRVYNKIIEKRIKLPRFIKLAYFTASKCNKLNALLNKGGNRLLSNIFYAPHYIMLKLFLFLKSDCL
jgi:teichuronic acid biosynthesis glycosyltransferase TuaG